MSLTPYVYKLCVKLREKDLQCLLFPMPCWHINEKTHSLASLDIQKILQLKGETCLLGTHYDKAIPSLELQLSPQPHEKK
jgi:hypothetical protein